LAKYERASGAGAGCAMAIAAGAVAGIGTPPALQPVSRVRRGSVARR
jgi:hypothetical protein